jgi:hypothetical protein
MHGELLERAIQRGTVRHAEAPAIVGAGVAVGIADKVSSLALRIKFTFIGVEPARRISGALGRLAIET